MRSSRPDIATLDGRKVALWGWGREGRAAYRALRARLPVLPLTLFCSPEEAADVAQPLAGVLLEQLALALLQARALLRGTSGVFQRQLHLDELAARVALLAQIIRVRHV